MKSKKQEPAYIPASTYRLQLNGGFRFADAAAIVQYLHDLGVTDVYLSPFLQARPGSMHGYDVTSHDRLNPEIGTAEDLQALSGELHQRGMGIIADVVPNHMCIAHESNQWWWDVLENGPSSPYARCFDIDWQPPKPDLENKILLPVLGDQFGNVLESGEIRVAHDNGGFVFTCYGNRYPIAPRTWAPVLEPALAALCGELGPDHLHVHELESILTALSYLPPRTETDEAKVRERMREKEIIRRRIGTLEIECPSAARAIAASVDELNGRKGDPASFDRLEKLLDEQAYRLAYWRVAADEINYRRFFDINELAAIRVEDPEVFDAVHRAVFDLVRAWRVRGLRIDHPDGLFEPAAYFDSLQKAAGQALFVVAEKILTGEEQLRPWAMEGTTGYGALNLLNGLLVDGAKKRRFLRLHKTWERDAGSYEDMVYESKRLILQVAMSSELNVLSRRLDRISEFHRRSRDFTLENLRDALREIVACFPIYRTYAAVADKTLDAEDARHVRIAVAKAKRRNPAVNESVFDFIQRVMLLEGPEGVNESQQEECRMFVMRLQQFTAPVMAKGVEDTVFYRYYPLASLNEVGGSPQRFGVTPALFHQKNRIRAAQWPHAMVATSTHDTKRSEDVRARISALSEAPDQWFAAIRAWRAINEEHKSWVAGALVPAPPEEYLFYQTLAGVWPAGGITGPAPEAVAGRIGAYMEKAVREAKIHTSWISPNVEYEQALARFVENTLASQRFLDAFYAFHQRIAAAGVRNSLSQTLLKILSPGVPDFYQGNELFDFSLVDPDNRRPVDYAARRRLLAAIDAHPDPAACAAGLLAAPDDGAVKLFVTARALRFRRAHRQFFAHAGYAGLAAVGPARHRVIAFLRGWKRRRVIAAAARFFQQEAGWDGTFLTLPRGLAATTFEDVLTGRRIGPGGELPLADVFSVLPVAILTPVVT